MKKLQKYWDDDLAEFRYQLVEVEDIQNYELDGSGIKTVDGTHRYGAFIADGNELWAKRQAEHYGIEIEEES